MPRLDSSLYESLAAFRLALRKFLSFSEAAALAAGLTSQQYQAMLVVKSRAGDGVLIRDLADEMLMRRHGAVQLIDRLVAGGWVERSPSPDDRRCVLVGLTRKGAGVLERLAAQHAAELLSHEPLLAEALKKLRRIGAPPPRRKSIGGGHSRVISACPAGSR